MSYDNDDDDDDLDIAATSERVGQALCYVDID